MPRAVAPLALRDAWQASSSFECRVHFDLCVQSLLFEHRLPFVNAIMCAIDFWIFRPTWCERADENPASCNRPDRRDAFASERECPLLSSCPTVDWARERERAGEWADTHAAARAFCDCEGRPCARLDFCMSWPEQFARLGAEGGCRAFGYGANLTLED